MSGYERVLPLSISPYHFVGTKPVAVLFGEERVEAKSWRQVYIAVIGRCNQERHENLMYLRDKVAGKVRVFLSASPDGMTRPVKIDEDMYGEVQYGSETMMHILTERILDPAHFDYSDIQIVLKIK
jgi:hypothetical protein